MAIAKIGRKTLFATLVILIGLIILWSSQLDLRIRGITLGRRVSELEIIQVENYPPIIFHKFHVPDQLKKLWPKCLAIISNNATKEEMDTALNSAEHYYRFSSHHSNLSSIGCKSYFSYHKFFNKRLPLNGIEEQFPVAFGILIYHEVDQFEHLFRAIYTPWNFYCIHLDNKAEAEMKKLVHALINCFPPNVFVVPTPLSVEWGKPSLLRAELECMKMLLLLYPHKWMYYINLTGEEFPLVTNMELVTILSQLKGDNIVEGSSKIQPERLPKTLPLGLKARKSSTHVALSYEAVNYIITNKKVSHQLIAALQPYNCGEEALFAILQYNRRSLTHFPGGSEKGSYEDRSYKGSARFKLWFTNCKSGHKVRDICILGVNDLPVLTTQGYGRAIAANKFIWKIQPMAWDCLQAWHYHKIQEEYNTGKVSPRVSAFFASANRTYH